MEFFRRKSPVVGIIVSVFIAFLLFCILLVGFVARSAASLINNMGNTVETMLEDKTFRTKISKTIVNYAPDDSVTIGEVNKLMTDEEIASTVGEFGAVWFEDIVENGTDPVDALIEALKDPEMEDKYADALDKSLEELDKDEEDFMKGAKKLAKKHKFDPPEEGSSNLEIAITIVEGTREKMEVEVGEVAEYVTQTQKVIRSYSFAIPMFSTLLFIVFNILLVAIFYGLFMLLTRHLVKPGLYLGAPYMAVGILLLVLTTLDIPGIVGIFVDIPKDYLFIFDVVLAPLFTSGLIALIVGVVLVAGSSAGLILINVLRKEPAAASVPAFENAQAPRKQAVANDIQNTVSEEALAQETAAEDATPGQESAAEEAKAPVCPNCGQPIEGTVFCTNCGARVDS